MAYTKKDLRPIPQYEETGIPLLRRVWDAIKADKSAWEQADWIFGDRLDQAVIDYINEHHVPPWNCGTAYCVAGHLVLAKGAKIGDNGMEDLLDLRLLSSPMIITPEGETRGVPDYAAELLGLRSETCSLLFNGTNTEKTIDVMVAALEENPAISYRDLYVIREEVRNKNPLDEY